MTTKQNYLTKLLAAMAGQEEMLVEQMIDSMDDSEAISVMQYVAGENGIDLDESDEDIYQRDFEEYEN